MIIRFSLTLLLAFIALPSFAQTNADSTNYMKIGVTAGFNNNLHNSEFKNLPGEVDCCSEYTGGYGFGPTIGVLAGIPIMTDSRLMIRLGYFDLNGDMTQVNTITGRTLNQDLGDKGALAEFYLDAAVSSINLTTEYEWNFFDGFNLYGGVMLGYLMNSDVLTYERLVSDDPTLAYLVNGEFRNIRGEQFTYFELQESNAFQTWVGGGIGYAIPIADIYVEPFLRYYYAVTDLASVNWSVSPLTIGVDAYIELEPEKETVERTIYIRDTTLLAKAGASEIVELTNKTEDISEIEDGSKVIRTTTISESYSKTIPLAYDFSSSLGGNYSEYAKIVIEETETKEAFPLLPYVFFGSGRSKLSGSSQEMLTDQQTALFDPLKLDWDALEIHDNLLNIVGKRMTENPSAKISLTGTNNSVDIEKGKVDLSQKRAESVKQYLTENWGIDDARISMTARNLPENPGRTDLPQGQAENSRVEISSTDPKITGYLNLAKIDVTSNPPSVDIVSNLNHSEPSTDYTYVLNIAQNGNKIRTIDGKGTEDVSQKYTWSIGEDPRPQFEEPIDITLEGVDEFGVKTSSSDRIQIEQLTIRKKREELKNDKIVERFSLIVFDYDSSDLTPTQKANLKYAQQSINDQSTVVVDGYTDNIGSGEYNLNLASRRIEEVVGTLGLIEGQNVKKIQKIPHGANNPPYSNATPKGRSYNRTVIITILNPVDK